jgi:hypothetical protein
VTRDRILHEWKFREKGKGGKEISTENIGCGYPSDPKTKAWLREHLDENCGLPEIVRFSWKTTTNLMTEKNCNVQFKSMMRNMTIEEYNNIGFKSNFLNPSDYIKEKKQTKIKVNQIQEYKSVFENLRMQSENISF